LHQRSHRHTELRVMTSAGISGCVLYMTRLIAAAIAIGLLVAGTSTSGNGCIKPPLLPHKGPDPTKVLSYSFIGYWDTSLKGCVETGIQAWVTSQQKAGNQRFGLDPVRVGRLADINVALTPLPDAQGGAITHRTFDARGYTKTAAILFTNDRSVLSTCVGFTKVTLHEFGHLMGLAEAHWVSGSSVMNQMLHPNDAGGNIPTWITSCDQAATATTMPRDPCAYGACHLEWASHCAGVNCLLRTTSGRSALP
jgi:hypothetical protein